MSQSDGAAVNYELGTIFRSSTAGQITSIRFWKDVNETGAHTGHIWSSTGTLLASVSSPALSDLLGWMLSTSDNDLAEAVAHLVAHAAGQPADFPGGVTAVTQALGQLQVPTEQLRMFDGSGLSQQTQVQPQVLADVLVLAAAPAHAALRPLLTGLAVAGFTGSLLPPRFDAPGTAGAAGLVRAKTGTLTGVDAIAGTVRDSSGRLLVFVFVADRVPAAGTLGARAALDRLVAAADRPTRRRAAPRRTVEG